VHLPRRLNKQIACSSLKGRAPDMNVSASLPFKLRGAFVLFAAACFSIILSASAQDKPATPGTAPDNPANSANSANPASFGSFAYDVVSIKPYRVGPDSPVTVYSTDDGFSYRGTGLLELVLNAYPIQMLDQVSGLPEWANGTAMSTERFDVEARMDEETAAALKKLPQDQQREIRRSMMQQVLAGRFNLKVHRETRELPVYNLVVARGGPKFKETPGGTGDAPKLEWGEISGDGIALDQAVLMELSNDSRRVVINKTGLTSKYSFSLKWNPYAEQDLPASSTDQYADQFKGRPDLFVALEEQLGLKLEPAKGPVDVYVIDHVEKPSEN
jgi:uncharacterized protein (TIGR03435 family)